VRKDWERSEKARSEKEISEAICISILIEI
jgi:hypothetical protein